MPAPLFINEAKYYLWMEKHRMADQINIRKEQQDLIKDIFISIDADGSGTMEIDELIKALLSLCLSQDIDFAKQIVFLFEENHLIRESKKISKMRLLNERLVMTKEEKADMSYSFKDFVRMFKKN